MGFIFFFMGFIFFTWVSFSFSVMDELKKLKKVIKVWEGEFEKANGRKPGKVTIMGLR
jgi:hypothetical protein